MQHQSPVVAIIGTGAGKSVLFMLPASIPSSVTIIVVPLVALRFNIKEQCDQLGIANVKWAQIMFVTPKAAVSKAFSHYINQQRVIRQLDCIIINKCYVVLDSLGGFRSQVLALRNLIQAETQMGYLPATLRPRVKQHFINVIGLPPKRPSQWFQGRTTRKNIQYQVYAYNTAAGE